MYNPFSAWPITGTWEDHASYSAGGTDYPLPNRTPLLAPASGTLRTSGGSGEWAAGAVGSAGLRSILTLDVPLARVSPRRSTPAEAEGPMVAVVFQHQDTMYSPGWYAEGGLVGLSGNTNGTAGGGDYHLHIHGLDAAGRRLRFESFIGSSTAGGGTITPIDPEEDEMKGIILSNPKGVGIFIDSAAGTWRGITGGESKGLQANGVKVTQVTDAEFEETKKFLTERQPK